MAGGLARHADHVDIVVHGVTRHLGRCLEQRTDVDVEADVGEGRGDHLGAPVVAVLAHLHHEDARAPSRLLAKRLDVAANGVEALVILVGRAVHTGDGTDLGPVATEHRLHGVAHLADRGAGASRVDAKGEEVPVASSAFAQCGQRLLARGGVPLGADLSQAGNLLVADHRVVDVEDVDIPRLVGAVLVDTDDDLFAAVDSGLAARGGLLDPELGHA